MNTREQIGIIFGLLKQHLQEKKISYRELASRTAMSESNVKRIFSQQTCDLERLIQFCNASEIKFFDLVAAASRVGPYVFKISEETEEFFCKNFDCFIFFREISTAANVDEGMAKSRLPKDKIKGFLKDLVRLKLLEKGSSSYSLRYTGYIDLPKSSKLRKMIEQKWVPWFFNQILFDKSENSHFIELFSTGLTEAHRLQLIEDIDRLTEKYREIGISDQKIGNKKYEPVAMCIGIGPYRIARFDS